MTSKTYITAEGYEAASVNNNYTRESIADYIRTLAKVFARTSNIEAACVKMNEVESFAVEQFGYTWDEVEALEIEGFKAA